MNLRDREPVLLPYLTAVGSPPLRFQTLPPPPDLTVRPAAAAPPLPNHSPSDTVLAASKRNEDEPIEAKPAPPVGPPLLATAAPDSPAPTDRSAPAPTKTPPPSIIPDDARPSIRPEDFLPYFQIPGSAKRPGDVNLLVPAALLGAPASAPVPPSSATYTQSK